MSDNDHKIDIDPKTVNLSAMFFDISIVSAHKASEVRIAKEKGPRLLFSYPYSWA